MMDINDALKIKNQLCFPLYLCSKEITRVYNEKLEKYNLTYTQYIVMIYFWEVKQSNLKEISKALMLDSSTLTPIIKKLENKGYVRRARSEQDERNLVITLTEAGEQIRVKAINIPEEVSKYVLLDAQEVEQLRNITFKIITALRDREQ
ncbi:MAG: MarR family transcriptional regulator [Clostridia bacterium]|nr:MarR family transcriptional regulator [Clostridia bacterium]